MKELRIRVGDETLVLRMPPAQLAPCTYCNAIGSTSGWWFGSSPCRYCHGLGVRPTYTLDFTNAGHKP